MRILGHIDRSSLPCISDSRKLAKGRTVEARFDAVGRESVRAWQEAEVLAQVHNVVIVLGVLLVGRRHRWCEIEQT